MAAEIILFFQKS